ncbi:hypothetical protein PANT_18c00026 [Moesziomyces antarcticus T-34]|uniref:Sfi1 spindle body domain-containing protein n=1 Tax=Pseudozyma antarctica (strain T-34) TaxID=1151754 RepID=M9M5B4_PSEA3|nr:hypothetical protein PANT_18c00026 [Moesziomyces antarcticus T-34]
MNSYRSTHTTATADADDRGRPVFSRPRPSSSGLDELRRNVHQAHARESTHRPYYPSPLSQSPLQASLSSTTHTAASVASTSRTTLSTSTTPPSTSSRFSIKQAFKALTEDDIHFFDRLMSTLPPQAADFSQLKTAYTRLLPAELEHRSHHSVGADPDTDWDTHLWSILLSLIKVRGTNWRECWDSVRLAFGLDPHSGDETDQSASTQSTQASASSSSAHDHLEPPPEPNRRLLERVSQRSAPGRGNSLEQISPRQQRATADFGIRGHSSLYSRSPSPPPLASRAEAQLRSHRGAPRYRDDHAKRAQPSLDDSISAIQARLSTLLDPDERLRDLVDTSNHSLPRPPPSSETTTHTTPRLSNDTKRRFDELVRSSQLERAQLRNSQFAKRQREQDERQTQDEHLADLFRQRRLLQVSLAWWAALAQQQAEKCQNAAAAAARVRLTKAWERWRAQTHQDLEGRRIGERTDRVRCTLTAFRRWKRTTHIAAERKQELRKESMRSAYYTTTAAVRRRLLTQALQTWRERRLESVATRVRRRHLQAGAFALWQMRSLHAQQLRTRERAAKAKHNRATLAHAWNVWTERAETASAVGDFQHHHNRILLLDTFHDWRRKAMLSRLAEAFTERRLKLAALDSWKMALDQRRVHGKQEALAARWHVRRVKQSALTTWRHRLQSVANMQRTAAEIHDDRRWETVGKVFRRWQLHARAALFDRAQAAESLQSAFHHWKHRHHALVESLQQSESTLACKRQRRSLSMVFQCWKHLAQHIQAREELAVARRNESICSDAFVAWRSNHVQLRLRAEKAVAVSDYFVLRSGFHQWRAQLREQRAEKKAASHDRRLLQQTFEIWRTRAAKQQRLESLLQRSLAKSNRTLARSYLGRWVDRIIEVRNRQLEVKEERDRRLVKTAFYAWIDACLRHDDLLALMNSYIDVKQEERKKRTFALWLASARAQKERREKEELLTASVRTRRLANTVALWRDRMRERALATNEYEMLMRRQQLSLQWALRSWKSHTSMLPAIRMRNTSLKRTAVQHWRAKLPEAQMRNDADRIARRRTVEMVWTRWRDQVKRRRQLRAAARFGAGSITAERLRTLSAAAAANRSGGSSSPMQRSSSPLTGLVSTSTPRQRPGTSLALLPSRGSAHTGRSSSLPRSDGGDSPSREASARRELAPPATLTATSASERSRFSLALHSSSSSVSPPHDPPTVAAKLDATLAFATQHPLTRPKRSAKYDDARGRSGSVSRAAKMGREEEEAESVRSAPVQTASRAVGEDLIRQLRERAKSRNRVQ